MERNGADYSALICINCCRRFGNLRRYLPHFSEFCHADPRFSLLVSLDGNEPDYLEFCRDWEVPLVYSEEREGVGISKNRVLARFQQFDYYFFLDDDVELVDGSVFPAHVEVSRQSGIHHFSLFEAGGVRKPKGESRAGGQRIAHGMFGGGQFNFFTREGLERVGGWHPDFAEYRRWGHTEHSYRFFRTGLAPAPFNVLEDLSRSMIWHYPLPVSRVREVVIDDDQLSAPERELLNKELEYFPVTTLSPHHFNGAPFGKLERLAATLSGGSRYPLATGGERRRARAEFLLWQSRGAGAWGPRMGYLTRSALAWPGNPMLRHHLKRVLFP